jgi:hypothetical protein
LNVGEMLLRLGGDVVRLRGERLNDLRPPIRPVVLERQLHLLAVVLDLLRDRVGLVGCGRLRVLRAQVDDPRVVAVLLLLRLVDLIDDLLVTLRERARRVL